MGGGLLAGALFLLTRYLQSVLGHSALTAGLMLLPLFAPLAVLSPLARRLAARRGPSPVIIAGAILSAAGLLDRSGLASGINSRRLGPALAPGDRYDHRYQGRLLLVQ